MCALLGFLISIADSGELEDGPEVALGACDRGLHSLEFVLFLLLPRRTLEFLRGLAGGVPAPHGLGLASSRWLKHRAVFRCSIRYCWAYPGTSLTIDCSCDRFSRCGWLTVRE